MDITEQAIRIVKHGGQIPLDLFYRLMEQGIDVTALEKKYGQ